MFPSVYIEVFILRFLKPLSVRLIKLNMEKDSLDRLMRLNRKLEDLDIH